MNTRSASFTAFLRHRYHGHVRGWLAIFVGWLWGYYIDQYAHEPLWAVLPAAYVGAFAVLAIGVAGAALLRFPWWFMAPLTFASMALEWALRKVLRRPWRRRLVTWGPSRSSRSAWRAQHCCVFPGGSWRR